MPYYRHSIDAEPITGTPFALHADARENCNHQTERITYVSTPEEFDAWTTREYVRFHDGTYTAIPWADIVPAKYAYHFAHISTQNPELIAYTKSEVDGYENKKTAVRAGRYLQQYYSDVLSHAQITEYANACTADRVTVQFTTDPNVIQAVYENGPRSCMSHTFGASSRECKVCKKDGGYSAHYSYNSSEHPVRVYGHSPDLALAYYGTSDNPSARALAWPAKKYYGRVYGSDVLEKALIALGYRRHSLAGARVRAIEDNSEEWIMPYIDDEGSVSNLHTHAGKQYFCLGGGDFEADHTTGIITEDNSSRFTCDNCGNRYSDDDYGGENMCTDCFAESYTSCYRCDTNVSNDEVREFDGNYYCDVCYDRYFTDCEHCNSDVRKSDATRIDGNYYCEDCAESYCHDCAVCSASFYDDSNSPSEVCEDCAETHTYCDDCSEWYARPEASTIDVRVEFSGPETKTFGLYPCDLDIPESRYTPHCSECGRDIKAEGLTPLDWFNTSNAPDAIETDTNKPWHSDYRCNLPADTFMLPFYRLGEGYAHGRLFQRNFFEQSWERVDDYTATIPQETLQRMQAELLGTFELPIYKKTDYSDYLYHFQFRGPVNCGYWIIGYGHYIQQDYSSLETLPRWEAR